MADSRFRPVAASGAGVNFAPGYGVQDTTVSAAGWQKMSLTFFAGMRVRVLVTATSNCTTAGLDFLFTTVSPTAPATTTDHTAAVYIIPRRLTVKANPFEDIVVPQKPGATWIQYRSLKGATTVMRITRI